MLLNRIGRLALPPGNVIRIEQGDSQCLRHEICWYLSISDHKAIALPAMRPCIFDGVKEIFSDISSQIHTILNLGK